MKAWERLGGIGERWPVWLVALVTLANGVVSVVSILLTRFRTPRIFGFVLPFGVYHWSRPVTVALGLVLIYLSYNLLERRRVAWWLAAIISVPVLAGDLIHPSLWPAAIAPAATLALLIVFRSRFRVRSNIRNIGTGLLLAAISLVLALGFGTLGFWYLSSRDFGIAFSPGDALVRTLRQFTLIGNGDLTPHTRFARSFLESLNALGIVTAAFVAYSLFRPVAYRLVAMPHEQSDATAVIKRYGSGSYDYFKDKSDKSFFFSKSRRTVIAYRTVVGAALVLGDPVGPDEERQETISEFIQYCSDNAWLCAFVLPDSVAPYQKAGLSLLKVGEEAMVNLQHFQEQTLTRKYFRYVRRKIEGEGYSFVRYKPPHPAHLLDEVEEVSKNWMSLPHKREFGFFQGTFSRRYISETNLAGVRDRAGLLVAWVNEVPSFRPGEATFDMMRHQPGVHWGIMDYLFANLMLALRQDGFTSINMGLAPLAGVGVNPGATLLERAVHQVYEHIGRVVSMKGLTQYKVKFEPDWEERFIAYQGGAVGLVRIGIALSRVL